MLGSVNVKWTANGDVMKDELIPITLGDVLAVGDGFELAGPGLPTQKIDVEFKFDPPLTAPKGWQVLQRVVDGNMFRLLIGNPDLVGTDSDVRLDVAWNRDADDQPAIRALYPCRKCGWEDDCDEGCHS